MAVDDVRRAEMLSLPTNAVLVALGASAAWSLLSPDVPAGSVQENEGCGIGSCRVPRPSLGDYVAGMGPRGAASAAGEC